MKLTLVGHDYKYAIEQIMLALFPQELPDYSSDPSSRSDDLIARSYVRFGVKYAQATTSIRSGDKVFYGYARVGRRLLTDKLVSDRLLQRIVKQSFFRAAKGFVYPPPVWGSLTGIRPAKLAAPLLESGFSEKSAAGVLQKKYYVSPERASACIKAALSALDLKRKLSANDIALYVGVPFCPSRCAYCSFISNSAEKSFGLIDPFVQALLSEIHSVASLANELGLRVVTIYIGGGTPTALPDDTLDCVLGALNASFDMSHLREFTVEAGRPDTLTKQNLDIMVKHGAGRICVNPQSMSDDVLASIGRRHTSTDVMNSVNLIRQSGAALTLNMDIIAGLPGDTADGFMSTLDAVLDFEPENVTVHTLSLKKGSKIMLEGTAVPTGGEVAAMLGYAAARLQDRGYAPYYLYRQKFTSGGFENTGWSQPGKEGIYNICMMEELCTVLSLGGGGVTKIISPDGRIRRVFNAKYPREYILMPEKVINKLVIIKEALVQYQMK